MKKYILVLVLFLSGFALAEPNEMLLLEIQNLNMKIKQLQFVIETQNAEIAALKKLCWDGGILKEPNNTTDVNVIPHDPNSKVVTIAGQKYLIIDGLPFESYDDYRGYKEWRNRLAKVVADAERDSPLTPLETEIMKLQSNGSIYSIDVEMNEVRIDPIIWMQLDLRTKQNLILTFSVYFKMKGSTGRVNILSNRNDRKLGSYSVWSGVKVIE